MTHHTPRILAALMGWSHPLRGALSVAAMLVAAGVLSTWLSPADAVRGNNRAAAAGVLFVALVAALYVLWRLLRYARLCQRPDHASFGANWTEAAVEAGRYLGLDALAAILVLAPIVGRQGYPLWALGYGEPVAWFGAGGALLAAVLTVVWPDGSVACGQRRLLPRISAAEEAMDRSPDKHAAPRQGDVLAPPQGTCPVMEGHARRRGLTPAGSAARYCAVAESENGTDDRDPPRHRGAARARAQRVALRRDDPRLSRLRRGRRARRLPGGALPRAPGRGPGVGP